MGSNPLPGTEKKCLPFFSSTSFLPFLNTARLPRCMRVCGKSPARFYLAGLQLLGSIINISKEREGYGVRSGARILEIDQVIRKLSRFFQVQSERERTLVSNPVL